MSVAELDWPRPFEDGVWLATDEWMTFWPWRPGNVAGAWDTNEELLLVNAPGRLTAKVRLTDGGVRASLRDNGRFCKLELELDVAARSTTAVCDFSSADLDVSCAMPRSHPGLHLARSSHTTMPLVLERATLDGRVLSLVMSRDEIRSWEDVHQGRIDCPTCHRPAHGFDNTETRSTVRPCGHEVAAVFFEWGIKLVAASSQGPQVLAPAVSSRSRENDLWLPPGARHEHEIRGLATFWTEKEG